MLALLRERTSWRRLFALLALLVLVTRIMTPAGFMPGTSIAAPIVLCPDQGTMPATLTAHAEHGAPKVPHEAVDHPCVYAGLGIVALVAPPAGVEPATLLAAATTIAVSRPSAAPGRGLAAPPPPSHAPPALHA